jgi:hypothetical protein
MALRLVSGAGAAAATAAAAGQVPVWLGIAGAAVAFAAGNIAPGWGSEKERTDGFTR